MLSLGEGCVDDRVNTHRGDEDSQDEGHTYESISDNEDEDLFHENATDSDYFPSRLTPLEYVAGAPSLLH